MKGKKECQTGARCLQRNSNEFTETQIFGVGITIIRTISGI